MSNIASKKTRGALVRATLAAFLCLPFGGLVQARSAAEGPRFFSISAVLGQAPQAPAVIDRSAPFKAMGYQLFSADSHAAAAKWAKSEAELNRDIAIIESCAETPRECTGEARYAYALTAQARLMADAEKVAFINAKVNMAVRYQSDMIQHGVADLWSSPLATIGAKGDCEDYAIAKYALLKASGLDEARLRLVLVHDGRVREDHAVSLGQTWRFVVTARQSPQPCRGGARSHPLSPLDEPDT